jgi:hypothetical protein
MIERFIHHLRVERPAASETATAARERLGGNFPRGTARRMTHLGMLLGATLEGVTIAPDDAVVYATTYAETRALEDFLASFPAASPLLFQTSIHPGGVQQVLIGRQQPAARLWPLAGRERLTEQALLSALLEPATRVVIAGGEERGTWLLENHMASDRAFAFGMVVTREADGAVASISLEPSGEHERPKMPIDSAPTLGAFVDALAERQSLGWFGHEGRWTLTWR